MAKRKRLTPFDPNISAQNAALIPVLETKAHLRPGLQSGPPIAQVAGDASAQASLREVVEVLASARAEGRLVQKLPLDSIDAGYLVRDRIETDEEELGHLMTSLRNHGQRNPIEVTELPGGRFGLISGWRRMAALARLQAETGEARFGQVLALLRSPDTSEAAYVAMVEENEVRLGLSYYERARIAAKAVELGVFASEKQALQRLFAAASRAKRSKIGSYLAIYHGLDAALRHPSAIPERLGLALARWIEDHPTEVGAAAQGLIQLAAPNAAVEIGWLTRHIGRPAGAGAGMAGAPHADAQHSGTTEIRPGVFLSTADGPGPSVVTLSGPKVDTAFRQRLVAWLRQG
jgi:ParB family chromosome partitioning protein